jgi:hypothetical protein
MAEGIWDDTLKGETPLTDGTLQADNTGEKTSGGRNPGGSQRITDPDDMDPDEPGMLRDNDKGLIQRYWRRKVRDHGEETDL